MKSTRGEFKDYTPVKYEGEKVPKRIEALEKENKALKAKIGVFDQVIFIKEKLTTAFCCVLEVFKNETLTTDYSEREKKEKSYEIER